MARWGMGLEGFIINYRSHWRGPTDGFKASKDLAYRGIMGEVTVTTLKRFLEAFNQHDMDSIMEFFAENAVLEMPRGPDPWGKRLVGKDMVRKGLAARLSGIPDVNYSQDRHWVCGDKGVSAWLLTGTTAAGVRIVVRGCDLFEFRDGKVVKKDSYWKIVDSVL